MKVSVIIPVYNVAPFIESCLSSVFMQTYTDIEVLLIDDCGTDESMAIVYRMLTQYSGNIKCRIIKHENNRGLSAARNTGIDAATGEYLYFLDSDDEIVPYCIERLLSLTLKENLDFVIGNYFVSQVGKEYPPLKLRDGIVRGTERILQTYLNREWYMMAWNKLINRSFLLENQLYFKEKLIHEDELWSFLLAFKASNMGVVDDKLYCYKVRDTSIMATDWVKRLPHFEYIVASMVSIVQKHYHNDVLTFRFIEMFCYQIMNEGFTKKEAPDLQKRIYITLRKSLEQLMVLKYCFKDLGIKNRLRNIHYLFPYTMGFFYLKYSYLLFSYISKRSLK